MFQLFTQYFNINTMPWIEERDNLPTKYCSFYWANEPNELVNVVNSMQTLVRSLMFILRVFVVERHSLTFVGQYVMFYTRCKWSSSSSFVVLYLSAFHLLRQFCELFHWHWHITFSFRWNGEWVIESRKTRDRKKKI